MDADDKLHQNSSSIIKQQSTPKLVIKLQGRKMIHPQQQCKEAEEEVMKKKKKMKDMSVSKHHNLLSISNTSTNSISNNSDSSLSPTTCSICGASFPSKKSLFGHMKYHPEREWRGIRPPPPPSPLDQSQSLSVVSVFMNKYNSPAASTDSDDSRKSVESYQGVGPLPVNWSNTGKRGRIPPSNDLLISSDDERLDDVVEGLLMLKEGNDLDVASMNKQISRETEGITMNKRKKKRMILESSSEDVSMSSDLLRSSKKIKIDQERSCGSSRDGFGPKLVSGNLQSSQLEQLPPAAAASNMFQEDCELVKNVSKKVKLADERSGISHVSSISSRDVLMNSIPEQLPQVEFSLLKNSSKRLKLDDEQRGCCSSMFDQGSHLQQMFSNGYVSDSKLLNSVPSSNHHLEQMSTANLEYFQGGFNSVFPKPAILMKANKKVKENEKGSSAADQNMGMQASCIHKCDTCNRTFASHQALGGHKSSQRNCKNNNNSSITYPFDHHQYLQCGETMLAVEHDYITETKMPTTSHTGEPKMPTTSHTGGTHRCEKCGDCFLKGQALGGHKRAHYQGGHKRAHYKGTSGTVHVNSMTMVQTDQLMAVVAQTEKLIKKEEMNRLSVVPVASSSVGEEVVSTTTTTVTKTENKPPVLDFDLNEIDLNETPNEMPDDQSWK